MARPLAEDRNECVAFDEEILDRFVSRTPKEIHPGLKFVQKLKKSKSEELIINISKQIE